MIGSSLIIDRSGTRPAWAQGLDWLLTALVWLLFLFLIRAALLDLYELLSETLGWVFAGGGRPSVPEITRFIGTLWTYFIVAVANGMILIAWARYNQFRFSGHDHHASGRVVNVDDLAALYRLPAADIERWQGSRILVMRHQADGTLIAVTSKDAVQPAPIVTGVGSLSPA